MSALAAGTVIKAMAASASTRIRAAPTPTAIMALVVTTSLVVTGFPTVKILHRPAVYILEYRFNNFTAIRRALSLIAVFDGILGVSVVREVVTGSVNIVDNFHGFLEIVVFAEEFFEVFLLLRLIFASAGTDLKVNLERTVRFECARAVGALDEFMALVLVGIEVYEQMFSAIVIPLALNAIIMVLANRQMPCICLVVTKSLFASRAIRMLLKSSEMVLKFLFRRIEHITVPTNMVATRNVLA